ncbi:hypothetical protein CDEST_07920 [Colletotrichum destructivum]|uniref:Uncharacterized protein n=1 Tax=Colletotrichum destructivum TaxID=34406 RepID=A0AAX4III0_9PEZI|nr:hypothetical protein CDEST_07920 [Colletotrichum destructivum]
MPFPLLSKEPIPGLSLSAAGLVALADLHTVANRTALKGTSSWLDALVLAPGLHYQQAADGVVGDSGGGGGGGVAAATFGTGGPGRNGSAAGIFGTQALPGGRRRDVQVTNPGLLLFLSRLGVREEETEKKKKRRRRRGSKQAEGVEAEEAFGIRAVCGAGCGAGAGEKKEIITLDVGTLGNRRRRRGRVFAHDAGWEFERGSHLLYLASPALTLAALTIVVLLGDCEFGSLSAIFKLAPNHFHVIFLFIPHSFTGWALASILALITSRLLNIYIIKQRTSPPPAYPPPFPAAASATTTRTTPSSSPAPKLSEYIIPLSPTLKIRLRGPESALTALATDAPMRPKTTAQNYLEAAAKLAVYTVAVFGGNVSQAGNLVLLVLLLGSAGLLGLSNGFVRGVGASGGRVVARVRDGEAAVAVADGMARGGREGEGEDEERAVDSADWDAQVGRVIRDPYPFEGGVEYS